MPVQPPRRTIPANRMAVLQRLTLAGVVIISLSMVDRSCNRVEFLRVFTQLNTMSKRKSGPKAGGNHLQLPSDTLANRNAPFASKSSVSLHAPGGILRSARKVHLRKVTAPVTLATHSGRITAYSEVVPGTGPNSAQRIWISNLKGKFKLRQYQSGVLETRERQRIRCAKSCARPALESSGHRRSTSGRPCGSA